MRIVCTYKKRCVVVFLPGAIPAQIYAEIMETLVDKLEFADHFMGYADNQVPFLGHGIGLAIDEWPVIAAKIESPLAQDMVIAP